MPDDTDTKPKTRWGMIVMTVVGCAAIFGFIYEHTVDSYDNRLGLKDDTIALLERENKRLTEEGPVPEAIKRLEQRIIPLTLAFAVDPFDGRVSVGAGQTGPTEITMLIIKAEGLRKEKTFDLAAATLDEIERLYAEFSGLPYFRFLIERDKGNANEALALSEQAIEKLPNDRRVLLAYEFAVNANLTSGNKKKAEELCLGAIQLDPKNDKWRTFFQEAFGYTPSIPKE